MTDFAVTRLEIQPMPLSSDARGSMENLRKICAALEFAGRAIVYFRVLLGRQLLMIQQKALWLSYILTDGNRAKGWDDWVERGFPQVAHASPDVARTALLLARSPTLRDMPAADLAKFKNLSNVIELVKVEKQNGGRKASPELVKQAQEEPTRSFRRALGTPHRVPVQVLADGEGRADVLERVMKFMRLADEERLQAFEEALEWARLRSSDNPNDAITFIHAAVGEKIQQEEGQWPQ